MKTFIYCGGNTMDNLGNGFLDIGALYQIKKAFPDSKIISISNTSPEKSYFFGAKHMFGKFGKIKKNKFDLRIQFDGDYYVFTAACLCDSWFDINAKFIDWLEKTQNKVIILGASGSDSGSLKYNLDELKRIRNRVSKINLHMMISRDDDTFDIFSDLANFSYNGIDCAMFLSDAFFPSKMKMQSFDIFTFDSMKEKKIKTQRNIIRLSHKVSDVDSISRIIRHPKLTYGLMYKRDWISDFPEDYLNLYANCNTVYSDRVHACVASLIFGNKAMYFGNSPRSGLLNRVLNGKSFMDEPVSLDLSYIALEKQKQLNFLKQNI